jgi:hypothetical protein
MRAHPVIAATAALFLLGGVAFAATGGYEMVRGWFVKVYLNGEEIDGNITDYREDPDGTAYMTLDLGDKGQAELEVVPDDGQGMRQINVNAGVCDAPEGGTIEIQLLQSGQNTVAKEKELKKGDESDK